MKTICECEKKGGGLGPVAGHFYDCPMGRQIHELTLTPEQSERLKKAQDKRVGTLKRIRSMAVKSFNSFVLGVCGSSPTDKAP